MTREEKLATFTELSKKTGVATGRVFADLAAPDCNTARLLIDHPHGYRNWRIIAPSNIPGFFYLESTFRLDRYTDGEARATFTLCLHESEFTRIH